VSLAEISARIAQIQALVASPAATPLSTGTNAAAFATSLQSALGSTTTTTTTTGTAALDQYASTLGGTPSTGRADGDDIAAFAAKYKGVPYVAGGRSPSTGWDCAGFTHWVAKQYGIDIPDVSWKQIKTGTPVAGLTDAKPGDLLFFHEPGGHRNDPSPLGVNHVAIYLGDGKMVEAANPHAGTRISSVDTKHLVGIRRIAAAGDGVARTPEQVSTTMAAPRTVATTSTQSVTGTSSTVPVTRPGGQLSPRELVSVLEKAGFRGEGLHTAWAVAMRESHGRPGALGAVNSNGTRDHGLFQLNDIHLGRSIDPAQVYDAATNAAAAFRMSKGGTNWSAWGIGHTGWAGHLEQSKPAAYAQINARFQEWYSRFPGA
jgi:cell wall-associated NlpC family hydrolase